MLCMEVSIRMNVLDKVKWNTCVKKRNQNFKKWIINIVFCITFILQTRSALNNQNCTEMLKNSMYCVNRLVIITSEKDRVSKGTLNTHDFRQVLQ